MYLPQGKVMGGSTSINGLVYNRGLARDYDGWAALGNTGWGYQDVLPYFHRSRPGRAAIRPIAAAMVRISDPEWRDPICEAFIRTVAAHGVR
ncbi:MAG: GMC family oxidoreductase N-terminal domain-containing protein [Burkholderiaceae bacterium]